MRATVLALVLLGCAPSSSPMVDAAMGDAATSDASSTPDASGPDAAVTWSWEACWECHVAVCTDGSFTCAPEDGVPDPADCSACVPLCGDRIEPPPPPDLLECGDDGVPRCPSLGRQAIYCFARVE